MKEIFRGSLYLLFMIIMFSYQESVSDPIAEDCVVVEVYEAITADYGVQVLTIYGTMEEADLILIPPLLKKETTPLYSPRQSIITHNTQSINCLISKIGHIT